MNEQGKLALEKARAEMFDIMSKFSHSMRPAQANDMWVKLRQIEAFLAVLARGDYDTERPQEPQYTTGHCRENNKPGGCQLHNLHCGYPECDRKAV